MTASNTGTVRLYSATLQNNSDVTAPAAPSVTAPAADESVVSTATTSLTYTAEAGSTQQCKIDSGTYAACTSPYTTAALADGRHAFRVRAIDAAGNVGAAAARTFWTAIPISKLTKSAPVTQTATVNLAERKGQPTGRTGVSQAPRRSLPSARVALANFGGGSPIGYDRNVGPSNQRRAWIYLDRGNFTEHVCDRLNHRAHDERRNRQRLPIHGAGVVDAVAATEALRRRQLDQRQSESSAE